MSGLDGLGAPKGFPGDAPEGIGAPPHGGWRGYYLTAYGIAVKHGFRGSEEEWLKTLEGERGERAELRFNGENKCLEYRYESEEEWRVLCELKDIQGDMVTAVLEEARGYAILAEEHEKGAERHEAAAERYTAEAESWAHGETGVRKGEDEDNGKYYARVTAARAADAEDSAVRAETAAETAAEDAARHAVEDAEELLSGYVSDAETARSGAESAAESARLSEEHAAASAEAAQSSAEASESSAKNSAESENAADTARRSAEAARDAAEAADEKAQLERIDAELAREGAETAAKESAAARDAAAASAEASERAAVRAEEIVGQDFATKEYVADAVSEHDASGEAHADIREELAGKAGRDELEAAKTAAETALSEHDASGEAHGDIRTALAAKADDTETKAAIEEVRAAAEAAAKTAEASGVTFEDGETFQQKYESGELKGEKGDRGEQGPAGKDGSAGAGGTQGPKGDPGSVFTPTVAADGTLSWTNNGSLENPSPVNIKGPKGDTGANGTNGAAGKDGVSPTVKVSKSGTVTTVEITDASGKQTATINDGAAGAPGKDGSPGATGPAGPNELSTSTKTAFSGLLKGNGSNVLAAAADTDFLTPATAAATYLKLTGGTMSGDISLGDESMRFFRGNYVSHGGSPIQISDGRIGDVLTVGRGGGVKFRESTNPMYSVIGGVGYPQNNDDAATKEYVDSKAGSGTLEFVTATKGSLSRDNGVQLNVDYSTGGKLVGVAADIRQDIAGVWNDGHFFCTLPSIPVNQEQLLNRQDWKQTGFWINGNNSFTGSDTWWLTPYTVSVDTSSKNNYNIWIYFSPKAIQMTVSSSSISLVSVTSTGLTRAQILIAK